MIPQTDDGLLFFAVSAATALVLVFIASGLVAFRLLPTAGRFFRRRIASTPVFRLYLGGFILTRLFGGRCRRTRLLSTGFIFGCRRYFFGCSWAVFTRPAL